MPDFDYGADLDFDESPGVAAAFEPSVDTRYPPSLHHVLFVWPDEEEDLRFGALGWLLLWRKANPFILDGDDGHFSSPIPDNDLWLAMRERIVDWGWAEKGGMNLEEAYTLLLKRHHLRIGRSPVRSPKQFPVQLAESQRECRYGKQPKPSIAKRRARV